MACPVVLSGVAFLGSTLDHIDCQAQSIGAFGFQALSAPNSLGATIVLGLLTLFIAVFGYRLLFGQPVEGRDVVSAFLKIGIVLTLATSWPAFRTVAYDTVLYGPAEVAGDLTGASDLASSYGLYARLQNVDTGIVALTVAGTGRNGEAEGGGNPNPAAQPGQARTPQEIAFAGVALGDEFGLGFARVAYLAGTLAPLAALRVAAGLLLGLAPLFAGLLLFDGTRGIFFGWIRALATVALGSLAMIVSLAVELALIEPWLTDVIARRQARFIAPAAPTELLVMTASFAIVALGLLVLFARLAFSPSAVASFVRTHIDDWRARQGRRISAAAPATLPVLPSRAAQVAERLTTVYQGERWGGGDRSRGGDAVGATGTVVGPAGAGGRMIEPTSLAVPGTTQVPLGSRYRRSVRRTSQMTRTRDRRA